MTDALLTLLSRIIENYEVYNPAFSFTCYGTESSIKPYMHQIEFVARNMLRRPLRVLLADEIGLGKTVTALVTLKRLERLGIARRILIAVPRILVSQWAAELRKIGIRFERITRRKFSRLVAEGFPEGYYLTSMDLIKRERYMKKLRNVPWDVIVVDEAHRLGRKRRDETQRYTQIGRKLIEAHPDRNVLLLSATPHRGDPYDYLSRLLLLDPYLESGHHLDNLGFYTLTHNVLVFRRRKKDVNEVYENRKVFTDCKLKAVVIAPTKEESEFHTRLIEFLRAKLIDFYNRTRQEPRALGLLLSLIFKRASSSPYAAIKTMNRILEKRAAILEPRLALTREDEKYAEILADSLFGFGFEDYAEYIEDYEQRDMLIDPDDALNRFAEKYSGFFSPEDVRELKRLIQLAEAIQKHDSRLIAVKELIRHHIREGRKVIVFTEYKDTANYILRTLREEFGENRVVKLTGDEANNDRLLNRIRRSFERRPDCQILVATDVASEGLNLQVANILINYEAPWSPIKLEQRIGRVWRLGQKSDVTVYTVFLGVESDRDVLDILYRKLIALGRSIGAEKPPIGEEAIVIDMEEKEEVPIQISEFRKNGKRFKASEYTFRVEYIKGGRAALNELVAYIIQSIERLREDLRRMNVLPRIDRETIERLLTCVCGFSNTEDIFESLKRLLVHLLSKEERRIYESEGRVRIIAPGGAPIEINDLNTAFTMLKAKITEKTGTHSIIPFKPVSIIVYGDEDHELYLYEISIEENQRDNAITLYREVIGVSISKTGLKTIRGAELLKTLIKALENYHISCDEYQPEDPHLLLKLKSKAKNEGITILTKLMSELDRYRNRLERRGWRREDPWFPSTKTASINVEGPLAIITFTSKRAFLKELELDPLLKKRIELKAMEHALTYEREQGREPEDVSQFEHFDILSRDPRTGEIRYIEVKGHLGSSLIAELTESEFKLAKEKGRRYWLYIVNNIGSGKPKLKAIRNPLSKMRVEILESKKYRLLPI